MSGTAGQAEAGAPARRVWGIGTPRTLRVHWMLEELGLEYETQPVMPRHPSMDEPAFLDRSLRGKVPIYEEHDVVMGESGAIVAWLADRYSDRALLVPPVGTPARAACTDLCQYALCELDSPLYTIRLHGGLPEIYGEAPAAVAAAREYFARMSGEIERRLEDGRPHLLGDRFTIADLLVVSCIDWAHVLKIELGDPLVALRHRVAQRPAYLAAMATNFPPEALAHIAGKAGAPA